MTYVPQRQQWRRALPLSAAGAAVNSTAASFVANAPTVTEPATVLTAATAQKVLTAAELGEAKTLHLMPFHIGNDDTTSQVRVTGWRKVDGNATTAPLWVPRELAVLTCTGCTAVGVANSPVLNTERFSDALTIVTPSGTAPSTAPVVKTVTANTPVQADIDIEGWEKIEIDWNINGSATSVNALWAVS